MSDGSVRYLRVRLEKHPPDAPKAIELVHEVAAEEGLECPIHVADRHAELQDSIFVDVGEELRRGGRERRVQERDLGPIAQLGHEALRVLPEVVEAVAGAILDEEVDAAGLADARDGGREERNRLRVGERPELRVQGGDDGVRLERRRRAFRRRERAGRRRGRFADCSSARGC